MKITLPHSTPEEQGISSAVIAQWVAALNKLTYPHSFMLMRHGVVIAEGWWHPYNPDSRHQLYSLSKSFTSSAIGLAISEGRLRLEDQVVSFFPDKLPDRLADGFGRMTVRDLLTMSSGHDRCAMEYMLKDADWVRGFFASPLVYEPGTRFAYNSGATYMLAAVLHRLTGQNLTEYLNPRLLLPLGIENARWDQCPQGIEVGGWGFHLTTAEIANFAQMLLQKGQWQGKQLLPVDYLELATSYQIDNSMNESPDWKVGYGFQFWRCQHNAFRGDGAFGQYAVAMPEQDMALAMTSGLAGMQDILTLTWDILLPAVHPQPLPADPAGVAALREQCGALRIPAAQGVCRPEVEPVLYTMQENPLRLNWVSFDFTDHECSLTFNYDDRAETLRAGWGEYGPAGQPLRYFGETRKAACSAGWTDPEHLEVVCCLYETPYLIRLVCDFSGGGLRLEAKSNLLFGLLGFYDWPVLTCVKDECR